MEIAIAAFIGAWLTFFSVWGYTRLKKDYEGKDPDVRAKGKEEKKS